MNWKILIILVVGVFVLAFSGDAYSWGNGIQLAPDGSYVGTDSR